MVKGKAIKHKIGDTLIEVTFAIGIFSMVAIAAISVVSASTSSTQTMLENTVTREEIDAQAEALRFIQDAYSASGERDTAGLTDSNYLTAQFNNENKYAYIWNAINKRALDPTNNEDKVVIDAIVNNYNPTTCDELYETVPENGNYKKSLLAQRAFVINTRNLGLSSGYVNNIFITPAPNTNEPFSTTSTFPRIVYGSDNSEDALYDLDETSNIASGLNGSIKNVEGLFVVGVKDGSNTVIISEETGAAKAISAYIDFYIRSCWYATGAETPSTISTVIRLYNPDTVSINRWNRKGVLIQYEGNDATGGFMQPQYVISGKSVQLLPNKFERQGYEFIGWDEDGDGNPDYVLGEDGTYNKPFVAASGLNQNEKRVLKAVWGQYIINYHTDSSWSWGEEQYEGANKQDCDKEGCTLITKDQTYSKQDPTKSGYRFGGWCTSPITAGSNCPVDNTFQPGDQFVPAGITTNLYAIWILHNEEITIELTWTASTDYDSYISGTRANGTGFYAYFGEKEPKETVAGVTRVLASLNRDCTGSCTDETFTINTLGGRAYYYYVRNYSHNSAVTDATVTVKNSAGTVLGTFSASNAKGSGRVWNVFAYIDGRIITCQRRSSSNDKKGENGAFINGSEYVSKCEGK